MARTALTITELDDSGITETLALANVDGHSIQNDGKMWIEVSNGGVAPITVTLQTPGTVDGLAIADRTVTVTNGTRKKIGPFKPSTYNQGPGTDAGAIYIDFSSVTTVIVAAFRLPQSF